MDRLEQRTLYMGLLGAAALYAVSFVAPFLISGATGQWVGIILGAVAVVFALVWLVAVRRGFRLGKASRQGKRLKEREARRPPATRLR